MQGTQYATKRSILCRGAFCGPTVHSSKSPWHDDFNGQYSICVFRLRVHRS